MVGPQKMRVKSLTSSSPLGTVRQDKGDGWQPDSGVGSHALPHRRVEDLGAHGLGNRFEKSAGSFVVVASLLETWEQPRQETVQACRQNNIVSPNFQFLSNTWSQPGPERDKMGFIDGQQC